MSFFSPVIFRITRVPAFSLKYLLKAFDIFLNLFQLTGSLERHLYQPSSSEVAKMLWSHCLLLISMFHRAPALWPPNPMPGRGPLIICVAFCLCLHLTIAYLNFFKLLGDQNFIIFLDEASNAPFLLLLNDFPSSQLKPLLEEAVSSGRLETGEKGSSDIK